MPHINVLSKEISELIAAGEVIERPSSVIKELVENSIDSGARHITVEIKNGGTTYMRVTDDGCGMAFDEVPTAFLRHATSKIVTKNDLDNINTLGFRGEALASVAAVSRVEVMTAQKGEELGTMYKIEGSTETAHEKIGCPEGTTIIIRDLFYNVPARAKFMKKDVTEANAVSNIMQKITMSHPDIAFRMIRDNRMEFNSAGDGELFSAVYAVFGRDFARDLIEVDYEFNGIRITGFVVKPLYARNNRTFQNFFVNGRYVRSRLCSSALENAYENLIMTGKFPACVLLLDMPPVSMDVNIHPAKAEVRFTNERNVTDAVYFAVKNALANNGLIYEFELRPKVDWTKPAPEEDNSVQQEIAITPIEPSPEPIAEPSPKPEKIDEPPEIDDKPTLTGMEAFDRFGDRSVVATKVPKSVKQPEISQPELPNESFRYISQASFRQPENPDITQKTEESKPMPEIKIIGEAFGLYIIAEVDGNLLMVDKHAAHERIIFERLRSRNCRQYSQALLTGIKVMLTTEEIDAMENNVELLSDMGFEFDFSEKPCVIATAVPTFVMELDIEGIICEVADNLRMHRQSPQSGALDDMLHTMACKAAIKANDKNSPEEMKSLVEQVFADENIRHCPHGRPVMFTMTRSSIDHQFKRS